MRLAVVDFGAGNLRSVVKALALAGARAGVAVDIAVTSQPDAVASADRIILPGDGAFADCRASLASIAGMDAALAEAVCVRGRPFLGICVGMQLLVDVGYEDGVTAGLGWIAGACVRVVRRDTSLKVPHMGWNTLRVRNEHPLITGLPLGDAGWHAYFLHGWHVVPAHDRDVVAAADYGGDITAAVARDNIAGVQFHPEKSQKLGLALLTNFLRWAP